MKGKHQFLNLSMQFFIAMFNYQRVFGVDWELNHHGDALYLTNEGVYCWWLWNTAVFQLTWKPGAMTECTSVKFLSFANCLIPGTLIIDDSLGCERSGAISTWLRVHQMAPGAFWDPSE